MPSKKLCQLIDPYWTLIPVLLDAWYRAACPVSRHAPGAPRAAAGSVLLAAWAVRLTHSYFRREGWAVGAREDWRYADMRAVWGKHWWWVSVVPVYAFQHALLAGLTLPLYANRCLEGPVEAAWGGKDWAAVGVALAGALSCVGRVMVVVGAIAQCAGTTGGRPTPFPPTVRWWWWVAPLIAPRGRACLRTPSSQPTTPPPPAPARPHRPAQHNAILSPLSPAPAPRQTRGPT